jgi:hypothetical protein
MIQIHKARNKSLDEIALEHYNRIKDKIKITDEQRKNIKNDNFCDYIENNLERIITCKPDELYSIIKDVEIFQITSISDIVLEIFFYSKYDKWQAYKLANDLGVDTCVYCNRQFISVVGTDDAKASRCEFDHFYAKSKFPYLALSFYNLIPSCHVCNSNLKGSIEFDSNKNIHPYSEGFDGDAKFTYIPTDYNGLVGGLDFNIQFAFYSSDEDKNAKIRNNISTFKLEEQYSHNKDSVSELIRKQIITSGAYLDILMKQYPDAFQSKEELYRFAFGNYTNEKDFHKRPLSKLTHDIAEELGLI